MSDYLTLLEEFDIQGRIQYPHLLFYKDDIGSQASLAFSIVSRKAEDILLVTSYALEKPGFLAGLIPEQAEEILKYGPKDYKDNLLKAINNPKMIENVMTIAQEMDKEMGREIIQNQQRVKNMLQYLRDNRMALQF